MGNLFFNFLFIVLHYIFTTFSVATIDGNVLFWKRVILLMFLNKEIGKMLITIIYQIFFSIIQRRYNVCNNEVYYILICLSQHDMGNMPTSLPFSLFSPFYCSCFKFKALEMLRKRYVILNIPSEQDNRCAVWVQELFLPLIIRLMIPALIIPKVKGKPIFLKIYLGFFNLEEQAMWHSLA